jgi:UDP-N-acetylglucosamine 4,6-dehydratase/5-epimerase
VTGETVLNIVRYGNVLFSRGSVIPLSLKQIKEKKTISVTESDMTRFLLPLKEATGLVTFAFEKVRQGDVFVRKASSFSVGDLVQAVKNIFRSDSKIKIIGMRHGEKLYETLASKGELLRSEDMGDYLRVRIDGRDLNDNKYLNEGDMKIIKTEDYNSKTQRA